MRHSPVDHDRTADSYADRPTQTPGLLVVAAAALAFIVCVANFALGQAGAGVAAAIFSMTAFGAGLAWLAMDRRRIRDAERDRLIGRTAR